MERKRENLGTRYKLRMENGHNQAFHEGKMAVEWMERGKRKEITGIWRLQNVAKKIRVGGENGDPLSSFKGSGDSEKKKKRSKGS